MNVRRFLLPFAVLAVFFSTACNVSDEGGGLIAGCTEDQDCTSGVCVDGDCRGVEMDAGNNGMDASNNRVDAGADMSGMDGGPDMQVDMAPECPEGRVDRNGDDSDGCELPAHPAANDPACEPCWNLQDAVGGCSEGTCKIVACLNDKTDRDGMAMNGCEADCSAGECWTPVSARQLGYARVDDDWIIGSGRGVAVIERDQGQTLRWIHAEDPRDFVTLTANDVEVLDDNRLVGVRDNTIVLSDDLGLSWRSADLPTAFGAKALTRTVSGRGIASGFSGTCAVRQCPAVSCQTDETCNTGVCEGNDCVYDSDCDGSSVCGANQKCVDPGNNVCLSDQSCGRSTCNLVGERLLVSEDFETWQTSGVQMSWPIEDVFTNADGSTIIVAGASEVHRTTDEGETWQDQSIAACPFIREVAWNSSDRVVLGGDGCLQASQDDGVTFSPASVPGGPGRINTFLWLDDSTVLAGSDDVILRSTDAGLNWVRSDVTGRILSIEPNSDGSLIALSEYHGVWTSTDDGSNWTNIREARNPLPFRVSSGASGVVGLAPATLLFPPSQTSIAGPWTESGLVGVQEIQQFGNTAFVRTGTGLWWGTDLMKITPETIDSRRVDLRPVLITFGSNMVPCGTSGAVSVTCSIDNSPVPVLAAAYNDSVTYVATVLRVRARVSVFSNTQTIFSTVNALMTSTDETQWQIIDTSFSPQGDFVPTKEGMITPQYYSTSQASVSALGDPRCDAGPFLVRDDNAIVSFERPELCLSSDGGASWAILATGNNFAERRGQSVSPVVFSGSDLGVLLQSDFARHLLVSGDGGANWRDVGVRLPVNADLSSDGTRQLSTTRQMHLRSN